MPLKSQHDIHDFCDKHMGEEFIQFDNSDFNIRDLKERLSTLLLGGGISDLTDCILGLWVVSCSAFYEWLSRVSGLGLTMISIYTKGLSGSASLVDWHTGW